MFLSEDVGFGLAADFRPQAVDRRLIKRPGRGLHPPDHIEIYVLHSPLIPSFTVRSEFFVKICQQSCFLLVLAAPWCSVPPVPHFSRKT